jgi:hypothetical protein
LEPGFVGGSSEDKKAGRGGQESAGHLSFACSTPRQNVPTKLTFTWSLRHTIIPVPQGLWTYCVLVSGQDPVKRILRKQPVPVLIEPMLDKDDANEN